VCGVSVCAEHSLPLCVPYQTPTSKTKAFQSRILYSLSRVYHIFHLCLYSNPVHNTHVVCAVSNVTCSLSPINQARSQVMTLGMIVKRSCQLERLISSSYSLQNNNPKTMAYLYTVLVPSSPSGKILFTS